MARFIRGTLLVGLGVLFASAAYAQANRPPAPVNVTNTVAQPVPVVQQGATQVLGDVNVTGTVEVSNTDQNPVPVEPQGTQDVNIVGGTVVTTTPVVSKRVRRLIEIQHGARFDPINVSLIAVEPGNPGLFELWGQLEDGEFFSLGLVEGPQGRLIQFTQRIRMRGLQTACRNIVNPCDKYAVFIFGD